MRWRPRAGRRTASRPIAVYRVGPDAGRGVLESGKPQDLSLYGAARCRRCARNCTRRHSDEDRLPFSLCPRQGAGGPAAMPSRSNTTPRATSCAAPESATTRTPRRTSCGASKRCSPRSFSRPAADFGAPRRRSDLHRRPAARRLDPGRADLASHSLVEGTMELPDIMAMARELG